MKKILNFNTILIAIFSLTLYTISALQLFDSCSKSFALKVALNLDLNQDNFVQLRPEDIFEMCSEITRKVIIDNRRPGAGG